MPPEIAEKLSIFWKQYGTIVFLIILGIIIGYGSVIFLGKNNPIELEVEKFIEVETGCHIDLTP